MKNLFAIILLLSLFSCIKEDNGNDNYFLDFRARECDYLFIVPGEKSHHTSPEGINYVEYHAYPKEGYDDALNLFLALHTHNLNVDSIMDSEGGHFPYFNLLIYEGTTSPLPDLETQIELNYKKKSASLKSNLKSSTAGDNLVEMEYRTDGVEKFNISALEKLFDQEPGTSLNEYFKIIRYDPDFIASADTHNLLYGFSDKDKPEAIDEWLNLSPLAPALMYIAFREVPKDLPDSIQFVVEMETDKGKVVRDTSQVIRFK
ncbi:MAG: hypothetical protein ACOCW8_01750 [bacterium]